MSRVITIFGSSQVEEKDPQYQLAEEIGRSLAESGFSICNGGYGGVMEASARGAKREGGKTIGITSRQWDCPVNPWIDEEKRMRDWRDRLFALIERGEAYIAFNGGTGTLVEIAVVWEMIRKGMMPVKPVIFAGGFWKEAISFLTKNPEIEKLSNFHFCHDAAGVLSALEPYFFPKSA